MKYKTQITEFKDIEVEVDPLLVIGELLENKLKLIPTKTLPHYDTSFARILEDGSILQVNKKYGYSYGHYEMDDEYHTEDITKDVDKDLLDVIIAYKKVLMDLEDQYQK